MRWLPGEEPVWIYDPDETDLVVGCTEALGDSPTGPLPEKHPCDFHIPPAYQCPPRDLPIIAYILKDHP